MENTILKVIGLFVMSIFIMSCEGYRCGDGKVYDADTLEPLDSVFCEVLTGSETQYTDSTGHFDVCNNLGGCVPDCSDIKIRFTKSGYKSKEIKNPENTDIYLTRSND